MSYNAGADESWDDAEVDRWIEDPANEEQDEGKREVVGVQTFLYVSHDCRTLHVHIHAVLHRGDKDVVC